MRDPHLSMKGNHILPINGLTRKIKKNKTKIIVKSLICKLNCDFNRYIFRTLLSTKSISTLININGYVSYDCILKHRKCM